MGVGLGGGGGRGGVMGDCGWIGLWVVVGGLGGDRDIV